MERDIIITKFLNQLPARFEVAEDDEGQLSACLIDIDDKTGKAKSIQPIRITPDAPFLNKKIRKRVRNATKNETHTDDAAVSCSQKRI